jgi:hypothetical protein
MAYTGRNNLMPAPKIIVVDEFTPFAQDTISRIEVELLLHLYSGEVALTEPTVKIVFHGNTDSKLISKYLKSQGYKISPIVRITDVEKYSIRDILISVDALGTYVSLVSDLLFLFRINEIDKAFRANCEYDWKFELNDLKYTINSQSISTTGVSMAELISSEGSHRYSCKIDLQARQSYIQDLFDVE